MTTEPNERPVNTPNLTPDPQPEAARNCPEGCVWSAHIRGGEPIVVPICMLCRAINWADIREQVDKIRAGALREAAAALPAYVMTGRPVALTARLNDPS